MLIEMLENSRLEEFGLQANLTERVVRYGGFNTKVSFQT